MTFPSNLKALIEQVNDELNNLERELSQSIELIRARINLFSENIIWIQLFATLNNYALFADNTRRRIQEIYQYLNNKGLSDLELQEAGEDLSEQLGRILEAKIIVNNIKRRLEN
ncbi:MAG: restriction endonuclease subunit S [Waterburya sp.]